MDWLPSETIAIDQATRIGLIVRIVFDNLALNHTEEDFVEGYAIGLRFFVGVVGNAYLVVLNGCNKVLEVHLSPSRMSDGTK